MQPSLPSLSLSARTVLVTVDFARASFGVDAETIHDWIDLGRLRWAFNIAASTAPGSIREIRIWAREFFPFPNGQAWGEGARLLPLPKGEGRGEGQGTVPASHALDLDTVISAIIGTTRDRLRAGEVQQTLLVSRPTLKLLCDLGHLAGPLIAGKRFISRDSLACFLAARCLNPVNPVHPVQP